MQLSGSPWREIPDWFYDIEPISNDDVENDERLRTYQAIQKYLGNNISPGAINEFLFGTIRHSINKPERDSGEILRISRRLS